MTQQNPRELLKQGDPQAIASSINRTLKPKGINAEVTRDNGCLHITLESGKVPDQMVLVDFIRTGMTKLGLESIHTVQVYGRRIGDNSPTWQEEIELMPPSPMLYEHETSMPNDSVGLDDVEPDDDSQDYYQDEEFHQDEDDEVDDEVDEEREETPPPKKQFPKWAIPVGILVPVMALAGLFFTGNLPFLSSSTSEPTSPEVPSPSPKPTSSASKPASPSPSASEAQKPASPASTAVPNAAGKPASPAPVAASPAPTAASGTPKASPAPAAASGTPKASPAPAAASGTPKASPAPTAASGTPKASPAPTAASGTPKASPAPTAVSGTPKSDPWREAVNQAQSAAILAQTAQSQTEWIAVANQWQKAVDLMNVVPTTSPNHQKAQQKATEYKSNLEVANRRAVSAP